MTARFLSRLQVVRASRKLDGTTLSLGAWVLTRPLVYESAALKVRITVPQGFRTDFASVPRLPFVYWLYGGDFCDEAATVHDWAYSTGAIGRKQADAVFREAMLAEGVSPFRAWPMWLGVRCFGASHYKATAP